MGLLAESSVHAILFFVPLLGFLRALYSGYVYTLIIRTHGEMGASIKGVILDTARLLLALHPPEDSPTLKIVILSQAAGVNISEGPTALAPFMCFVSADRTEPSVKNNSCTAVNLWSFCQGNLSVLSCLVVAYLLTFVIDQEVIILPILTPCS